jgi:hypothetical protein
MELRMKRGRGYVSADKNFDEDLGIGWIPVDSVHSPVKKVNYLVEAARVGQAEVVRLIELLKSAAFARRVRRLPGYHPAAAGSLTGIDALAPAAKATPRRRSGEK